MSKAMSLKAKIRNIAKQKNIYCQIGLKKSSTNGYGENMVWQRLLLSSKKYNSNTGI